MLELHLFYLLDDVTDCILAPRCLRIFREGFRSAILAYKIFSCTNYLLQKSSQTLRLLSCTGEKLLVTKYFQRKLNPWFENFSSVGHFVIYSNKRAHPNPPLMLIT